MIRELTVSQGETLKTCWTLWQAGNMSPFTLGRENADRAKSLVARGFLSRSTVHSGRKAFYRMTVLGEEIAYLRFGSVSLAVKKRMAGLAGHGPEDRARKILNRATPATGGDLGGPGEEDSTSSPPSAGPPGAVTLTLEEVESLIRGNVPSRPGVAAWDVFIAGIRAKMARASFSADSED
jgi:hypothetical protein